MFWLYCRNLIIDFWFHVTGIRSRTFLLIFFSLTLYCQKKYQAFYDLYLSIFLFPLCIYQVHLQLLVFYLSVGNSILLPTFFPVNLFARLFDLQLMPFLFYIKPYLFFFTFYGHCFSLPKSLFDTQMHLFYIFELICCLYYWFYFNPWDLPASSYQLLAWITPPKLLRLSIWRDILPKNLTVLLQQN